MLKLLAIPILLLIFFNIPSEAEFCENSVPFKDVAFVKIGSYKGFTSDNAEYKKTYFAPRYAKSDWYGSKAQCKSFGLELATFETLTEAEIFLRSSYENPFIKSYSVTHFWIDGMTLTPGSPTDWYWTKNGEKISFPIPWQPDEPNFAYNEEFCLSVWIQNVRVIGFNDGGCLSFLWPYICQRIDYFVAGN